MKILIVNSYYYLRGGDCKHAFGLQRLLLDAGNEVHFFSMKSRFNLPCNDDGYFINYIDYRETLKNNNLLDKLKAAERSIYSKEAKKNISKLLDHVKPDIVHLHSIRHHITKSIFSEFTKRKIPVVWTLHDYKELCPNTSFYNGHTICEKCKNKKYYHVILNKCKKNSLPASIITYMESMINSNSKYGQVIDLYISPSSFLRDKFIEYGYSPQKVLHLPNFIEIENFIPEYNYQNYILYLGRLEKEKGVETLIKAFAKVSGRSSLTLKIAGTGSIEEELKKIVIEKQIANVQFEGFVQGECLESLTKNAKAIIIPSEWYENYPFSGLEAMAYGKPIIASKIGGLPELVEDGITGFLYKPFDESHLAEKLNQLNFLSNIEIESMGRKAREKVERVNSKEKYLSQIISIYKKIIEQKLTKKICSKV